MIVYCRSKHRLNKGFDYTRLSGDGGEMRFVPAPDMPPHINTMFDLAVGAKIYVSLFTDGETRLNLAVFGVGFSGSDIVWSPGDDVWMINMIFVAENAAENRSLLCMASAFTADFAGQGNKLISCFRRVTGDVEYALDESRYADFLREPTKKPPPDIACELESNRMYFLFTPEKLSAQRRDALAAGVGNRYSLKCDKRAVAVSPSEKTSDEIIKSAFSLRRECGILRFLKRLFRRKK